MSRKRWYEVDDTEASNGEMVLVIFVLIVLMAVAVLVLIPQ